MRVEQVLRDPILYYKLDPGEMGLAIPARASESILRVASHELGNIRRFEAEAALEGGVVVYKRVSLDLAFEGSFLAARAGRSEARIIYRKKGDRVYLERLHDPDSLKKELKLRLEREKIRLEARKDNIERDFVMDPSSKRRKIEDIERKIERIESLIRRIELGSSIPILRMGFLEFFA